MARKIDTVTTSQDMDHLWGEIHRLREGTATVKVDRETLTRLLIDHGKLLNHYEKS